jgi:hypothetical protein
MKSLKYIVSALLLSIVMIGCGQPDHGYVDPEFDGAPEWVFTPYVKGKVAEVGSAPRNKMNNFGFQRELAMANARTNLAKRLNVKVKSMFKTYTSTTSANGGTMDATAESVTKQITKQSLKGSMQQNLWTSKSGTMYVLMVIDTKSVAGLMEEHAKSAYGNDVAAFQRFQAAKAQGELDKALESR